MRTVLLALLFLPIQEPTPKQPEPDTIVHRMGDLRWQHGAMICGIAVLPGEKQVLTAGYNDTVVLFDLETGERLRTYSGVHAGEVMDLSLFPGGRKFATAGKDGKVALWEIGDSKPLKVIQVTKGEKVGGMVRFARPSFDGTRLVAVAGYKQPVRIYDSATGAEVGSIPMGDTPYYSGLALHPRERQALIGTSREVLQVDLDTSKVLKTFVLPTVDVPKGPMGRPASGLESIGWDPVGEGPYGLLTGSGFVHWNPQTRVATEKKMMKVGAYRGGQSFFTQDGKQFVSIAYEGFEVWDVERETMIKKHQVLGARFTLFLAGGKKAVVGTTDGTVLVWDLLKDAPLAGGGAGPISSVAVSPDGRSLLAGYKSGKVTLWDLKTGDAGIAFEGLSPRKYEDGTPMPGWAVSMSFSSDGRRAVSGHWDSRSVLWNVESGKVIHEWSGLQAVTISPDGRRAAAPSALYNLETGETIKRFELSRGAFTAAVFTPDGKHVVTGANDQKIRVMDAQSGVLIREFEGLAGRVVSLALSPDGRHLVSGTELGGSGIVWEFESGKQVQELKVNANTLGFKLLLAMGPEGRWTYTPGEEGQLWLWDIATGTKLRTYDGHVSPVTAIAISQGGRFVTTGSSDSTVIHRHPGIAYKAKSIAWAEEMKKDGETLERAWKRYALMLASDDHEVWLEAMERGVALGDALVAEILNRYPAAAMPAPMEKMKGILKKLDDEDIETRQAGIKALTELGEPAYGWIRDLLSTPELSSNVRAELETVKRDIEARPGKPLEIRDRAELNLVLILLEQPDTEAKRKGLERFAQGPVNSVAARLARRHVDRR